MEPLELSARGLGPVECPDVAAVYRHPGPFVTCYFGMGRPEENTSYINEVQWAAMRRELEEHDVTEPTIGSVARSLSSVPELRPGARSACVVASQGEALLVEGAPWPMGRDCPRVGPLPALGTLLAWRQRAMTYITVLCDRAGADIVLHGHGQHDLALSAGERDHHDPLLHKDHAGGWSYPRYQHRVENTWERNAKDVLDVLDRLVVEDRPRVVVFGGDPRACGLLRDHASAILRPLLQELPLSRAADGRQEHDAQAVAAVLNAVVAAGTAELMAHFREMRARSLGAEGAGPVLAALTAAQVETLLLQDQPGDERTAYISLDPLAVGPYLDEVAACGGQAFAARLVDAALAGAFLTGARAHIVAGAMQEEDGIAAILRFAG